MTFEIVTVMLVTVEQMAQLLFTSLMGNVFEQMTFEIVAFRIVTFEQMSFYSPYGKKSDYY